jgi:hypothetical protein
MGQRRQGDGKQRQPHGIDLLGDPVENFHRNPPPCRGS